VLAKYLNARCRGALGLLKWRARFVVWAAVRYLQLASARAKELHRIAEMREGRFAEGCPLP